MDDPLNPKMIPNEVLQRKYALEKALEWQRFLLVQGPQPLEQLIGAAEMILQFVWKEKDHDGS